MKKRTFSEVVGSPSGAPGPVAEEGAETPEQRLKALGLELPSVASGVGDYEPWVEMNGVIYTSGQLPWVDGVLKYTGKLGDKLTVEDGYQSFRLSALNAIAQLRSAAGELSRIKRIARVEGSFQAVDGFTDHAKALDGASHLINEVFGPRGRHTRMVYCDPAMALDCTTLIVLWAELEQ
ncbi:MAG: RidA family protein [Pseudomonadota bacterium]